MFSMRSQETHPANTWISQGGKKAYCKQKWTVVVDHELFVPIQGFLSEDLPRFSSLHDAALKAWSSAADAFRGDLSGGSSSRSSTRPAPRIRPRGP